MDFELSQDQEALAEGTRALLSGRFPLERIRRAEGTDAVVEAEGWAELGKAGVFSLTLPVDKGGLGLGLADATVVFEELGRALVPGPLVATHLAAHLSSARLAGASEGDSVVGVALRPAEGHQGPILIEHFGSLQALVVIEPGRALAVVDPAGIDATSVGRSLDPLTPLARVDSLPDGEPVAGGAQSVLEWVRDERVLTAALCVGLAAEACERAVGYAKGRRQFGRAIGSFQAVKHICADMLTRTEIARAAVHAAALNVDQADVGDVKRAVAGAALLAAEAAVANAKASIQVHGGMGFTWEVPAHLYLMRAKVLASSLGSLDELARQVAHSY